MRQPIAFEATERDEKLMRLGRLGEMLARDRAELEAAENRRRGHQAEYDLIVIELAQEAAAVAPGGEKQQGADHENDA